jgi:hypothetical protein
MVFFQKENSSHMNKKSLIRKPYHMPAIPATGKEEIGKMEVEGQL